MKIRNIFFIVFFLFLNGCTSVQLPDISSEDIAEICEIDISLIQITKTNNAIEFKVPYQDIGSQWIRVFVDPISIKEFSKIKQDKKDKGFQENSNIGDDAFIYINTLYIRTMLFVDRGTIYKIESIIEDCSENNDLIQIAEKIIS